MKRLLKLLPWFFLALFAGDIVAVLLPKSDGKFHTREFGRLPVLLNGRIQPMDSVARNSLLQIRSTGDLPLEQVPSWKFWQHPKKLKSTEWLLEVFFKPDVADMRPIFLIHHPDLISELKLGDKGIEKSGLRYYTFEEIRPSLKEISDQAQQAGSVKDEVRTTYQKQVLKLANAVFLYQRLKNSVELEGAPDFAKMISDYEAAMPAGIAAFTAQQSGGTPDRAALEQFARTAQPFDALASLAHPLIIPPVNPEENRNGWVNMGAGLLGAMQTGEIPPAARFYARMAKAYSDGDAAEFNSAIAGYKAWLEPEFSHELTKGRAEYYFNQIKIFLHATIIYIFAFVLAGCALLTLGTFPSVSESMRRSAFYLIALAFVAHTFGLIFRMVLEGRPPVTNLYSSAIFIGWAACLLGLIFERVYKVGIGSAVAGLIGFITLLIAHNLAVGGDTMEMLRAVLDTNFWLATHVVTVTLGYASTFFGGLLAIIYIALGIFTPVLTVNLRPGQAVAGKPDLNVGKVLTRMVYAIVCFATLFSFVGTVLGGIWADQSWGRFWGWDPKENGALLIVLWNAIILHARWGKLVGDRGLMNLAVFGNIVTSFSWFGVNMLGIGLHSYGFMDAAFKWLVLFVASQVMIITLGSLPLHLWRSFQSPPPSNPGNSDNSGEAAAATV
ncbi:MAG TPA: cytochrome c biogenesis protein CcsA [Verrucomicrobiae bacterium]|nr:cytochrome c biogenesis protein CcsA [Verrucomicrobiae bacterium]